MIVAPWWGSTHGFDFLLRSVEAGVMADSEPNAELWQRLRNESGRQCEGFGAGRDLPPKDRNLINAWRLYSGNGSAPKVPPNFKRWHDRFA